MNDQSLSTDIINTLSQNIIDQILCPLPIRDAVRTSILSTKWRYSWMSIPTLRFDGKLLRVSSNSKQDKKRQYINAIFHVLLLHNGPLLHFTIAIGELNMTSEIDPIILHLSKNKTLKSFYVENKLDNLYKIPSALSSFLLLEDLRLQYCSFELPLTFSGLDNLRILIFYEVRISTKTLQRLLVSCPLLQIFQLANCQHDFNEGIKFTFIELFECLPSIVHIFIDQITLKHLAAGGMPLKLSTSLMFLKSICLSVCLMKPDELSSLLCIIRSSPNLEQIDVTMYDDRTLVEQSSMNLFDLEGYSSYKLNYLNVLTMVGFRNLPLEMEFVKFIMTKSPVLNKVQITLDFSVSVDEEVKMLRGLVRYPIPHASPSAELIIER